MTQRTHREIVNGREGVKESERERTLRSGPLSIHIRQHRSFTNMHANIFCFRCNRFGCVCVVVRYLWNGLWVELSLIIDCDLRFGELFVNRTRFRNRIWIYVQLYVRSILGLGSCFQVWQVPNAVEIMFVTGFYNRYLYTLLL